MIVLRVFVNQPMGKTLAGFVEMLPRLGAKYNLKSKTVSKPREAYGSEEYLSSGQPKAPALMLGDELRSTKKRLNLRSEVM